MIDLMSLVDRVMLTQPGDKTIQRLKLQTRGAKTAARRRQTRFTPGSYDDSTARRSMDTTPRGKRSSHAIGIHPATTWQPATTIRLMSFDEWLFYHNQPLEYNDLTGYRAVRDLQRINGDLADLPVEPTICTCVIDPVLGICSVPYRARRDTCTDCDSCHRSGQSWKLAHAFPAGVSAPIPDPDHNSMAINAYLVDRHVRTYGDLD